MALVQIPETEHEKTYSYPLDIQLKFENKRVQVEMQKFQNVFVTDGLPAKRIEKN